MSEWSPMFDDLDLEALRRRPGVKWAQAGPGVLPAWIADMDFPVPPPVREALAHAIEVDLGYPAWDDQPGGTRSTRSSPNG
jgi:cysteine-S-conjugate beta-lyase